MDIFGNAIKNSKPNLKRMRLNLFKVSLNPFFFVSF